MKRFALYYLEEEIDTVLAENLKEAKRVFFNSSWERKFEVKRKK